VLVATCQADSRLGRLPLAILPYQERPYFHPVWQGFDQHFGLGGWSPLEKRHIMHHMYTRSYPDHAMIIIFSLSNSCSLHTSYYVCFTMLCLFFHLCCHQLMFLLCMFTDVARKLSEDVFELKALQTSTLWSQPTTISSSFFLPSWAPSLRSSSSQAVPTLQTMLMVKHCGGQITALRVWGEPCDRRSSLRVFRQLCVSLRMQKCVESRTRSANSQRTPALLLNDRTAK
jgi:hypothetical protein